MIAGSTGASHASATALLHARMHDAIPGQARKTPSAPPEPTEPTEPPALELTTQQLSLVDALATLVGLAPAEIQETLASGQRLEDVAAAYGVDLAALSERLGTTTGLLLDVKA